MQISFYFLIAINFLVMKMAYAQIINLLFCVVIRCCKVLLYFWLVLTRINPCFAQVRNYIKWKFDMFYFVLWKLSLWDIFMAKHINLGIFSIRSNFQVPNRELIYKFWCTFYLSYLHQKNNKNSRWEFIDFLNHPSVLYQRLEVDYKGLIDK